MEEFGAVTRAGKLILDPVCRQRLDIWAGRQKDEARWRLQITRESPNRENSQNRAHFERCGILGKVTGADKKQVSDELMEDAFIDTGNPAFGEYRKTIEKLKEKGPGGELFRVVERFYPNSTTTLTKDEFWRLKRAAYDRLQFLNEDVPPDNWTLFPERGEGSVILRMCARWEERPEDIEQ